MASGLESRGRKLTLATAGERPSVLPSTNLGRVLAVVRLPLSFLFFGRQFQILTDLVFHLIG